MSYQNLLRQLAILRRRAEAQHDLVIQTLDGAAASPPVDSISAAMGKITGAMGRDNESTSV